VSVSVVARRYAKALLELGTETGQLEAIERDLSNAAEAYESSQELRQAIESPLLPYDKKRAIIEEIAERLGCGPTAKNTLLLLNDRRRMRNLAEIARALKAMTDEKKGIVHAEVISARPLSEEYHAKLKAQLERLTGKKIVVDRREDPSLIAGVVARIGDRVYDGSLRARLSQMKSSLLN
jgi:F-type H+-transporting ATPase subunit delta